MRISDWSSDVCSSDLDRMHPLYQDAIAQVSKAAGKHGKAAGVLLQDVQEYEMYYKLGYRFLECGSESSFVVNGDTQMAKQLNEKKSRKTRPEERRVGTRCESTNRYR